MYILIIGCGKIGSSLARELSSEGNDVVIVDNNQKNLDRLGSGFNGTRIKGVEFDTDILKEAGIGNADVVLAMTQDDNTNIMASQIAKDIFGVNQVVARIFDPNREFIYKKLGLQTISTTQLVANIIKTRILEEDLQILSVLDGNMRIVQFTILKSKLVSVGKIEEKFHCIISSIMRGGNVIFPSSDKLLQINDKIVCTISKQDCEKLTSLLSRERAL
ncbi:TrkA family potassium uptake protein [Clostridium sp. MB40-C1]|uniref:potassium channel family protein n=1 Tax=Clostridium sp. MB40-C1 TaxID=3070996 RepID=UPI0027E08FF2|nr:TrkA family potassium uptake protein [Clostridium sp. MB40-C1]WMJ79369.1 TrkA family potassium uptake protein [Clostridium sp. MB40-C1]